MLLGGRRGAAAVLPAAQLLLLRRLRLQLLLVQVVVLVVLRELRLACFKRCRLAAITRRPLAARRPRRSIIVIGAQAPRPGVSTAHRRLCGQGLKAGSWPPVCCVYRQPGRWGGLSGRWL